MKHTGGCAYDLSMRCNIDAKGKTVRLISGLIVAGLGLILLLILAIGQRTLDWAFIAAVMMVMAGAFMIFEGWAGWCVVRAMGIRTRG